MVKPWSIRFHEQETSLDDDDEDDFANGLEFDVEG